MSIQAIDALVFDLGGVIVAHDNSVMHRALAARCRAGWSAARVAEATADARWGTGRSVSELHAELVAEAGYDGDWDAFAADFCCHLVLDGSMLTLVELLAIRHRVMIFSNTNEAHWQSQVRASGGRLGAFERHLSYEMGHAKPSPRSFQIVAETACLSPHSMLFFDDVPANVEAARRAGFRAEVFESEARLRAMLAKLDLGDSDAPVRKC
jgi:FMN phosphatase YigB (HAD superfamily)